MHLALFMRVNTDVPASNTETCRLGWCREIRETADNKERYITLLVQSWVLASVTRWVISSCGKSTEMRETAGNKERYITLLVQSWVLASVTRWVISSCGKSTEIRETAGNKERYITFLVQSWVLASVTRWVISSCDKSTDLSTSHFWTGGLYSRVSLRLLTLTDRIQSQGSTRRICGG